MTVTGANPSTSIARAASAKCAARDTSHGNLGVQPHPRALSATTRPCAVSHTAVSDHSPA
jgi:hypothetical protein